MDPLARLGRKDKWFLGGGKGAIYAPPFPKHLLAPGFWDECYLADIRIPRLFTVLFLDERGNPIKFESYHKGWRPDRLTVMHYSGDVVIRERRCVTEGNAWVTELELVTAVRPIHVFLWAMPEVNPSWTGAPWQSATDVSVTDHSMRVRFETAWPGELTPDRTGIDRESIQSDVALGAALPIHLEYGSSHERISWTVNTAQRHDDSPLYEISVLPEKFARGRLPGDFQFGREGFAHLVQHYILEDRKPLVLACGAGLSPEAAQASLEDAVKGDPIGRSGAAWREYFQGVPQFDSSDDFLTSAYWYRWYGLRLNTVDLPLPIHGGGTFAPFVTEGVGFFRNFVSYSAQAHLREVSWMHDPSLAIGILDNLDRVQRADGSFPGHSYSCRPSRDFYHADFASGANRLLRNHGILRADHMETLRRYADYLVTHRAGSPDPTGATMYNIFDQNETGQEYMSRYRFANRSADDWASFCVGGVDATEYALRLFGFLCFHYHVEFKDREKANHYAKLSHGARLGLIELAYDPEAQFFCDVTSEGVRSPERPATGLYPLATGEYAWHNHGIPMDAILERWLQNRDEFWLPAGFPATAKSDDTFNAEAEWKDRRLNCPWNGRSWPMANCHLVEGFATIGALGTEWSRRSRPEWGNALQRSSAEALMKTIRLMFHQGDPFRPNSYEHYDPITGVASLYRGYDDYMHSWIVDLIMHYAVGVGNNNELRPLPLDIDWIECSEIPRAGGRLHAQIKRENAKAEFEAS